MKAIFVAAGEGSRMKELTASLPKSLIEVNGKSILQRQLSLLKKLNINDILIITGPFSNKYEFENTQYLNDKNFKEHDQLGSIVTAINHIHDDVLIIFGDILFDESILKQICKNNSDIVIAVDMDWSKYEIRDENPIDDADKVSIDNNRIKRIFKQKIENDDNYSIGEFIGLLKLNSRGSKTFREIFSDLEKKHKGTFHDAPSLSNAKLVDFLQEMIEREIIIHPEIINGKWCEIDTIQDLEIAKKMFKD